MTHRHYDVLVIGSGGGTKISTPASRLGLKAAIIEKDRLGGTCLNRGCIPSKMLIHPAEVAHEMAHADRYGLEPKSPVIDFPTLVSRVSETIDAESDSILPAYRANENLDYYHGRATFIGERRVKVRDFELSADKVYIATGSRPFIPNIEGLDDAPYMTSTEALRLTQQPKKLLVLGGGYIALELAFYFAALGTETHVFVRDIPLRNEDTQIREHFQETFAKRLNLHLRTPITRVQHQDGTFTLSAEPREGDAFEISGDALLVGTGVVPNSDQLGLDKAGVEVRSGGYIKVDDHLRTTAENVWALGDVVGNYMFRHSVNWEGEYLFHTTVANWEPKPIEYGPVPHAVFTSPQVAGVGETEDMLMARGAEYVVGFCPYARSAMGMALRSDEGFVKLLIERGSKRILGCHIIGEHASVLLHQVIALMAVKGTLDHMLQMIYIHPALNEIVRNAARDAAAKLL